ncbi:MULTISPECIES: amino acid ABC transporter permease [unclassified Variovorax]|uniref:amino acid ABC transporter permease n=1 Tax=unclassified Variovorax TaxID=663243 RepID=UPI001316A1AB|nr:MULTISPECIES: amino acid ABC transporter permease [unclassified Variovorax]VTU21225.1 Inner membrane amino-acid ABC transporter permease protein YhdY [Variovorax sp. SRS16]VTU29144.1 Inner membrane amino-acid ABC transporter permease protein YhdY [Variovorax sp. PBL-E5]
MNRTVRPAIEWRRDLWGSPLRALATLVLALLIVWVALHALDWGVVHAVFRPDAEACRALRHGACWGVIAEKWRPFLFGRYPYEDQWRPAIAVGVLSATTMLSAWPRSWRVWLLPLWVVVLALFVVLMRGGVLGLAMVPTSRWGGLPLTIGLAVVGLALAFPLSLLLALGRRSQWPVARTLSATYIELVRGVPLISVLFMASFLLPLLWPASWQPDVLVRVLAGLALFVAAYLAEIIRGGLQAVPRGQIDAAMALGFGRWAVQRDIVLPQALRLVVPAITNTVVGTLKDTSLVTVVGLFELTGALGLALGGDPTWRPFYLEGYLFLALVYWVMCFGLARYAGWLERRLAAGRD